LHQNGYQAITASDGIEAMVKALKELPFLTVLEVNLPKIYGFEVSKRLKQRPETRNMKFIMVSSPYDKARYKREPESLYESDAHIEEHRISEMLIQTVNSLMGKPAEEKEPVIEKPEVKKPEPKVTETKPRETTERPVPDDGIERAKRLVRTIVSDIYLYNTAKAEESIRNNSFFSAFASEIREGLKLYESRIPPEVRSRGDFFKDIINDFIEKKKKITRM
jgi:CheY-like chemotaxis protein